MVKKIRNSADNEDEQLDLLLKDLTGIVEREVRAYQALLDNLVRQQGALIQGDTQSVSRSSEEMEKLVQEARQLKCARHSRSVELSRHLEMEEAVTLSKLIPHVEDSYANRLEELREMLLVLTDKIRNTNERNRYLLEHSLNFVDSCLKLLAEGQNRSLSYSRTGFMERKDNPLFQGTG